MGFCPADELPASTQTFRLNSDGEGGPFSGRDAPPPPPIAAGGSSRDRVSALADGGPTPETSFRESVLVDDEGNSLPRGTSGVITQVKEAARASKQYEKVVIPPSSGHSAV